MLQGIGAQRRLRGTNRQSVEIERYQKCSAANTFILLTLEEKSCGFWNTTMPPNKTISLEISVISFRKSICDKTTINGSEILLINSPK